MRKKLTLEQNVLEAAIERMNYLYDNYDNVIVSFSGGKDSTAVMNIALKIATERDRLPLNVQFFDEEAIHPPTIEYVTRVRERPDINLTWFALEFEHRNACSSKHPYWWCWDKTKKDLWVRPMPDFAVSEHPLFYRGITVPDFSDAVAVKESKTKGRTVVCTGIRTQESLRRYRMIALRAENSYITHSKGFSKAHPIYDWGSDDVWRLVKEWGLDYNRTYDVFNKTQMLGGKLLAQRVCPPFGEEPLRGLAIYAECFPEMWHRMVARVDGVATAWRYSNTTLYLSGQKPKGMTWKDYCGKIIQMYEGKTLRLVKEAMNAAIVIHENKTPDPIPDEIPHPSSGCSWKFLCKIAIKGDLKGRTNQSMLTNITRK